tara:strand:+ start:90 stop:995 length:906 start_codon:yes stop_codon:yes gene_type:complete
MLEIPPEGGTAEGLLGLTPLQGLARVGLGRTQLQAEGLAAREVEGLYQLLFVYSVGLQHSVQQNLKRLTDAAAAPIALRWWRALVAVAERLLRTQLRTELIDMLHGMEDDVHEAQRSAAVEGAEAHERGEQMQALLDAALRVTDKSSAAAAERACQLKLLSGEMRMQEEQASGLEASLQAARWGWQSAETKLQAAYSQLDAKGGARASAPKAASKAVRPAAPKAELPATSPAVSDGGAAAAAGGAPKQSEAAARREMAEQHKEQQAKLREEARHACSRYVSCREVRSQRGLAAAVYMCVHV